MRDIQAQVQQWVDRGLPVVMATVVSTWGSSPRQPGARMAVGPQGEIVGSVSGGCVEAAVVSEALECIDSGASKLLHFGVNDEDAWSVGLSCGGRLDVLVEPMVPEWWAVIADRLDQERPTACVSSLDSEHPGQRLLLGAEGVLWSRPEPDPARLQEYLRLAEVALDQGFEPGRRVETTAAFVECLMPRPRLILVGGAHVAVALQSMARELGFRVVLIDPRRVFATPERFPQVEAIYHQYPQEVFPQLELDADTFVAVLTHDPKIDDPALLAALPSPAPYVGVLSSRKTHQKRLRRLRQQGLDENLLARIRTPIGLDIGARTPEEIALAIMAEIVAIRRGAA